MNLSTPLTVPYNRRTSIILITIGYTNRLCWYPVVEFEAACGIPTDAVS